MYDGVVIGVRIHDGQRLYRILYTDEDEEELTAEEVRAHAR